MRILTIAALAALSLNSYAVEYTPVTDVPFDIIHMHDTTTWERLCESFDGVCDVPSGTYNVKLLDRNWNELHVIRNVQLHDGVDAEVPTYSIGSTGPAGGFVFYVTNDGLHGLEAAPVDQDLSAWGWCSADEEDEAPRAVGATGTRMGSGEHNTQHIVEQCGAGTAADVADAYELNGYYDWYLPSKDELISMYRNLYLLGMGGFLERHYYWSSSETGQGWAWRQYFAPPDMSDNPDEETKRRGHNVRAVRTF